MFLGSPSVRLYFRPSPFLVKFLLSYTLYCDSHIWPTCDGEGQISACMSFAFIVSFL